MSDPKTLAEALADPYPRPVYMDKGTYKAEVSVNGQVQSVEFTIS